MSISTTDAVNSTQPWQTESPFASALSTRDSILVKGSPGRAKIQTLSGNNGTFSTNLFEVSGIVAVLNLYGIVSGAPGNCTVTYYDLWDGTASIEITDNAGTNISNAPAGSLLNKIDVNTQPLNYASSAAGYYIETSLALPYKPFILGAKNGAATFIRFTYTTTDTPISGTIVHYVHFVPLFDNGNITPV